MARRIPSVAHRIWCQGRENLPDHLAVLHEGFEALHPTWTTQWWDDERILDLGLVNEDLYLRAGEFVPPDSANQMRADIARIEILHRFGGVYLDTDNRFLAPIDPVLTGASLVTCYEVDDSWVANGFIAANPKHTILTQYRDMLPGWVAQSMGRGWRANRLTGPHPWTHVLKKNLPRADTTILPAVMFHPVPYDKPAEAMDVERLFPNSIAVHQWDHQASLRKIGPYAVRA